MVFYNSFNWSIFFRIYVEIWEFWIKTSFLHMEVWHTWLAFHFRHLTCLDFDETRYSSLKHRKIHILAFESFQTLLILKLSSSASSPTLTLMDDEDSNVNKMISTHLNLNPSNVLDFMSQEEMMTKKTFWDFDFYQLRHLNPNSTIDQNPQIAISQFLLTRFQIWR